MTVVAGVVRHPWWRPLRQSFGQFWVEGNHGLIVNDIAFAARVDVNQMVGSGIPQLGANHRRAWTGETVGQHDPFDEVAENLLTSTPTQPNRYHRCRATRPDGANRTGRARRRNKARR